MISEPYAVVRNIRTIAKDTSLEDFPSYSKICLNLMTYKFIDPTKHLAYMLLFVFSFVPKGLCPSSGINLIIMDFYRVIRTQRTITKFRNGNIPKNKMLRILQAANLAPSSSDRQPWNFLIVQKSSTGQMKAILGQSYEERVKESGALLVQGKDNKTDDLKEFYRTFGGAPITIVVYVDKETDPSMRKNNVCDASAAIDNLILAAWCEGIGCCWIAGLLNEEEAEIRESLGMTEDKEIIGIIPIGIPAHTPKNKPKEDIRTKVKWFGL